MRSPRTAEGHQTEGTATMTTDRNAMATVATVTGTKWSFPERGRTVGEVQTGAAGQRVDGTGQSTKEGGLPPDTEAGIAAGT